MATNSGLLHGFRVSQVDLVTKHALWKHSPYLFHGIWSGSQHYPLQSSFDVWSHLKGRRNHIPSPSLLNNTGSGVCSHPPTPHTLTNPHPHTHTHACTRTHTRLLYLLCNVLSQACQFLEYGLVHGGEDVLQSLVCCISLLRRSLCCHHFSKAGPVDVLRELLHTSSDLLNVVQGNAQLQFVCV